MRDRPLWLRLLPDRLQASVWGRFFRGRHAAWPQLYIAASLRYAPAVTMRLVPGDAISDQIAFTGIYELELTRRVVELSRRGGAMFEVGANLGYFSLLWAAGNPGSRSIAFEASPRNVELLRENVRRNSFDSQIEVVPFAAGRAAGKLRFDLGPPDQTGWGGFAAKEGPRTMEVDVVRVDEFADTKGPIDLLKIDIEGADTWALIGCEKLLKRRAVKEIWYEQNKPRMRTLGVPLDEAQEYLRSLGYAPRPMGDPAAEMVEWSAVPA